MHIALLASGTNPSGNHTRAMRIKKHFEAAGHDVTVIDSNNEAIALQLLGDGHFDTAIGIHLLGAGKILIQTTTPFSIVIGGTDINVGIHDAASREIIRTVIQKARYCICPHQDAKNIVSSLCPEEEHTMIIVPHGIEVCPSTYNVRSALLLSDNDRILFLPSGIRDVKDPLFAIPVIQKWHQIDPHIHLVIAGNPLDKRLTEKLEHLIRQEGGIHYLGALSREDTHAAMEQSNIVLNTSLSEGLSNAILEAMMLGTPVLARNVSGNSSLIHHQNNGFLFTNKEDLQKWAQWILTHDTTAIQTNARNEILTTYSLETERNAYQNIL
ncbi:MAG: glycosyltransferase family 4 protein [bacterium]|nr:glycosyltransferase family 4 protein [bacterium]